MTQEPQIMEIVAALNEKAPAGYALALHIGYSAPVFLLQTYKKDWTDYYSQNGLVLKDPTVAWGFANTGTRRWSDMTGEDTSGVMKEAATHGLVYGVTCAVEDDAGRSISSFARSDREYADDEISFFLDQVGQLHRLTTNLGAFSPIAAEKLRDMSVRYTHSQDS